MPTRTIFVLSDSTRLSKYTNFSIVKHNTHRYTLPVFTHKFHAEYVKQKSKHAYPLIEVDIEELKRYMTHDIDISIINNMYCSLDDNKEYVNYENL